MAHNRTAWGELQPDPTAFPNGMKAVADYVSIQTRFIIKSVSNHNGNGNDWHVKKAIVWRNKTTTLRVQHTFLYISLPSMHGYIFFFFSFLKTHIGSSRILYQNHPKEMLLVSHPNCMFHWSKVCLINLSHFKSGCKLFSFFEKIFECIMVMI